MNFPSAADAATAVAQTGSLPYRGLAIRRRPWLLEPADYQSAIQQVSNLRYDCGPNRLPDFCRLDAKFHHRSMENADSMVR